MSPSALKAKALAYLAQRDHSVLELRRKLLRELARPPLRRVRSAATTDDDASSGAHDAPDDEADALHQQAVDEVLAGLQAQGHLSDQRFTESRIHARASRFGNRRIEQELQQHGVGLDEAARQALQDTELARALAVWQQRFGRERAAAQAPPSDLSLASDRQAQQRERARQHRFLAQRGFSSAAILAVLKQQEDSSS